MGADRLYSDLLSRCQVCSPTSGSDTALADSHPGVSGSRFGQLLAWIGCQIELGRAAERSTTTGEHLRALGCLVHQQNLHDRNVEPAVELASDFSLDAHELKPARGVQSTAALAAGGDPPEHRVKS